MGAILIVAPFSSCTFEVDTGGRVLSVQASRGMGASLESV